MYLFYFYFDDFIHYTINCISRYIAAFNGQIEIFLVVGRYPIDTIATNGSDRIISVWIFLSVSIAHCSLSLLDKLSIGSA